MSLVSGVRFQVSEKDDRMRILIILNITRCLILTPACAAVAAAARRRPDT